MGLNQGMKGVHNMMPIEILVAEDEETDAFFVQQAFEQSKVKNNVHLVKDGQEAINFLTNTNGYEDAPKPHLIFLDIKMPRKDGHEALKEIKAIPELRHIPVIILSGSKAHDDVRKSYENFASAHVPKSSGFNDMLEFINCVESFWFSRAILPQES